MQCVSPSLRPSLPARLTCHAPPPASKGQGEDCTLIKGAQGVTCESGRCTVYTCSSGYELDSAFKRPGGGSGRCKKVKKAKRA